MKCGLSIVRRIARGRRLAWAPALLLLALAAPASSAPVTVFFDGPFIGGEHKGLDAGSLPAGVPVLDIDVFTVTGSLDVVNQSADDTDIGMGPAPNLVTSQWVVENVFGAFPGTVYLLFATALNDPNAPFPTTYNTNFTDEMDEDHDRAGLVIDPVTGWVVVETEDAQSNPFYYVGVPLDFTTVGGDCGGVTLLASQACVDVTYFLENPDAQVFGSGGQDFLVLPELQILMAVVVPEPSTVLFGTAFTVK
jgi:hypothetical protein